VISTEKTVRDLPPDLLSLPGCAPAGAILFLLRLFGDPQKMKLLSVKPGGSGDSPLAEN